MNDPHHKNNIFEFATQQKALVNKIDKFQARQSLCFSLFFLGSRMIVVGNSKGVHYVMRVIYKRKAYSESTLPTLFNTLT